jgi:DNA-binding response OmpR family regulator
VIQIALIQKFAFYISDATLPLEDVNQQNALKTGKIQLDAKSKRVWVNNHELIPPLSVPQFKLLHTLSQQSGKVISRNDLIEFVWEDEQKEGISEQAFDALIRRLRTRLAEIDPDTVYLVTVRGHGIRLDI